MSRLNARLRLARLAADHAFRPLLAGIVLSHRLQDRSASLSNSGYKQRTPISVAVCSQNRWAGSLGAPGPGNFMKTPVIGSGQEERVGVVPKISGCAAAPLRSTGGGYCSHGLRTAMPVPA